MASILHPFMRPGRRLPNMSFTGWLNQQEIEGLLRLAHVGLVPCMSVGGTVPNKVFDYLAAGLPIVLLAEGRDGADCRDERHRVFVIRAATLTCCTGISSPWRPIRHCEIGRRATRKSCIHAATLRKPLYHAYADHIERIAEGRGRSA